MPAPGVLRGLLPLHTRHRTPSSSRGQGRPTLRPAGGNTPEPAPPPEPPTVLTCCMERTTVRSRMPGTSPAGADLHLLPPLLLLPMHKKCQPCCAARYCICWRRLQARHVAFDTPFSRPAAAAAPAPHAMRTRPPDKTPTALVRVSRVPAALKRASHSLARTLPTPTHVLLCCSRLLRQVYPAHARQPAACPATTPRPKRRGCCRLLPEPPDPPRCRRTRHQPRCRRLHYLRCCSGNCCYGSSPPCGPVASLLQDAYCRHASATAHAYSFAVLPS